MLYSLWFAFSDVRTTQHLYDLQSKMISEAFVEIAAVICYLIYDTHFTC